MGGYPIKLHLGCGGHVRAGWVNCDLNPKDKIVLPVDLLNAFPFPEESVRLCYAEHVLEHFSIEELRLVLKNIFKVMQAGGTFRIAQPDLQAMIKDSLYSYGWKIEKMKYSKTKDKNIYTGTHYLNFIWNEWGHKFNHSYDSLKYELNLAGFREVTPCTYHKSGTPALCFLEKHTPSEDALICEAIK